jgi:type II restriction/modification system DNA methylase subunit YeeA
MRAELEDGYVDSLFALYDGRVPREADLVCYWFECARELIADSRIKRVGLLATQGIRGGANRRVLQHIKQTGDIFFAESDRPWILEGAAVHVSMVGFDDGSETEKTLDGTLVEVIYPNLTSDLDITEAVRLPENFGIAFMGDTKGGPFNVPLELARKMLAAIGNPNGRPNSDVVRPWVNGHDITRRPRHYYIIDFGTDTPLEEAALYEAPFEYVNEHVRPVRETSRTTRSEWWLHERPRVDMREALARLPRFLGTPRVTKHRLFVWLDGVTIPDSQVIAFARDDDYLFGVLHSKVHELWARRTGTQLREAESGFRYTPSSTFETFPLPWPPGKEPTDDPHVEAIADAAHRLDELRRNWLNPEGTSETELKRRTLTNLYNNRPTWIQNAHRRLDEAVFAAYGWPSDISDEVVLKNLLALNLERGLGRWRG